mmetsp:Transcript_7098/g.10497  ORF Transcript_7098/g.10497 Transcript_7098/m.10497 type:complete len:386 (-) Transcript_7098:253-1410(-)|eukprot:CAMPEP_0194108962 /NCGR_PEP_ID=MMETSP0150-20130528/8573_1 /TAXON_ID=122233 /ORGANISM="Chaetoceros debilis, Strain MM31A-1" /LENGTH=385 /DNA_ID=CAMNT_0038797799 /DNA_START=366 /DNA_END=1523 /DNA_ORIENTATION=-
MMSPVIVDEDGEHATPAISTSPAATPLAHTGLAGKPDSSDKAIRIGRHQTTLSACTTSETMDSETEESSFSNSDQEEISEMLPRSNDAHLNIYENENAPPPQLDETCNSSEATSDSDSTSRSSANNNLTRAMSDDLTMMVGADLGINQSFESASTSTSTSTMGSSVVDNNLQNLISSTNQILNQSELDIQAEVKRGVLQSQGRSQSYSYPYKYSSAQFRAHPKSQSQSYPASLGVGSFGSEFTTFTQIEDADDHVWKEVRHLKDSEVSLQHEIDFAVDKIAYRHDTTKAIQDIICENSFCFSEEGGTGGAGAGTSPSRAVDIQETEMLMENDGKGRDSLSTLIFGRIKDLVCCGHIGTNAKGGNDENNNDFVVDSSCFDSPMSPI